MKKLNFIYIKAATHSYTLVAINLDFMLGKMVSMGIIYPLAVRVVINLRYSLKLLRSRIK